jgi:hypothetical protein
MVFASAAARTTALASVLAEGMVTYLKDTDVVEIYTGAAWVSLDDPNAIQNSIVDAKGDLIAASADNTPARLAVGNNGETLVADSAATTGLRYQANQAAGKNYLINGAMENWQRGTTSTSTSVYLADRWYQSIEGASAATISQSTSVVPTNYRYSMKMQRTAANTGTGGIGIGQSLETTASIPLQGQTVVMSFWLKAGANFSAASGTVNTRIFTGTGTDQSQATAYGSWTGYAETSGTATATTSWTRYSVTATIPSGATQAGVRIFWTPVGTAGADDSLYITGIQMEIGSVATSFTRAGGTLQGELAACQRYFQKSYSQGVTVPTNSSTPGMVAVNSSTNLANGDLLCKVALPVVMRTAPTVVIYSFTSSQTGRLSAGNGTDLAAGSGGTDWIGDTGFKVGNGSGSTVNQAGNGFAFHYAVSAEL